jgi:signal transduction histidine kinase/ActR/RegA family two-component response regulator
MNQRWRLNLTERMALLAGGVVLVALLVMVMLGVRQQVYAAQSQFASSALGTTHAMLPLLENSLVVGDLATIQQMFDAVVANDDVRRLDLLDPSGKRSVVFAEENAMPQASGAPGWFVALTNAHTLQIQHPVRVGGVQYGVLRLEMAKQTMEHRLWSAAQPLLWSSFAVVVVVILALHFMLRRGLLPLRVLAAKAQAMAMGDPTVHMPNHDLPDLQAIWHAIDELRSQLHARTTELVNAREAADAGIRAKATFLTTVGHEIRTPMNSIIGLADVVLDSDLTPHQRDQLSTLKGSALDLLRLLSDVLDLSKIDAGKLTIVNNDFAIRALLTDTMRPLIHVSAGKPVDLSYHVGAEVPVWLHGDAGRLRQIVVNLVSNALKFTDSGSVHLNITSAADAPYRVSIEVTDTGIGIAPERLSHVFEAFEQADNSSTRRFGGTGLGLTISARLIALMDGQMGVESRLGHGSRFFFTLPFAPADKTSKVKPTEITARYQALPAPSEPVAAPRLKPHVPLPTPLPPVASNPVAAPENPGTTDIALPLPQPIVPMRILLVDDQPVNQQLVTLVLKRWGHHVTLAHNGQEALEVLATGTTAPFDLVLMDWQMPVMDGLQATRAIRHRESLTAASGGPVHRLPIVALTAQAQHGDEAQCLAAGMDGYLAKPFQQAEVAQVLARFAPPSPLA